MNLVSHSILRRSLPALAVLAVLAMVQAPLAAQIPPPFTEDFEAEPLCGTTGQPCPLVGPFTNLLNDNKDWTVDDNGTPSSLTGPTANGGADHNPGTPGGNYLYLETSQGSAGFVANLQSPLFDLTGVLNPRIKFWYHMYGAAMGTMHLDLFERINAGADGMIVLGPVSMAPDRFTTGGTGIFTPAHVGTQITVSGSMSGNDGVYTITTFVDAANVDITPAPAVEAGFTYVHEAVTLDFIPAWTDNQDLWQEQSVLLTGAFLGGGSSNAFNAVIRGVQGTSFTSDMAVDDFTYDDAPANDVGIASIDSPTDTISAGMATVSVTIQNFGAATQTMIPVTYQIDANPAVMETYMGSITPGSTDTYTFTTLADFSTPGTYTLTCCTALGTDTVPANDCMVLNVSSTGVTSFPYMEDFEGGMGGWSSGGASSSWAFGTPAGTVINSAASGVNAWMNGNLTGPYNANEQSFVAGPFFTFTGLVNPTISLSIWYESEFSWDGMALQSSTDGGMSWQNVGVFGDPNNWYNDNSVNGLSAFTGNADGWTGSFGAGSNGWVTATHALDGLAGAPSVQLRIVFGSDSSVQDEGVAFDDVMIFDAPISTFPYTEDFEDGTGGWSSGGSNDTWAFGTPAKAVINSAASGVNCWVNGGLTGNYNASEQSFVQGPELDFSAVLNPTISLSIWWQSEFTWDGLQLQSSIDGGMSWQKVGAFGDPDNWYNDNTVNGLISFVGDGDGWCGRVSSGNGSGGWITAKHALNGLGGQSSVILRFIFGSDTSVQDEGIAFDDIEISDPKPYPGSGEDFAMGTGVNGAPTSGPGTYVKTAVAGDFVTVSVGSPGGSFDFFPYLLAAQLFPTGMPPAAPLPYVHLDPTMALFLVDYDPSFPILLPPGGASLVLGVPSGFAGNSVIFQAAALTPFVVHGVFSTTDGYEIQLN